jgi:hypothetical protein
VKLVRCLVVIELKFLHVCGASRDLIIYLSCKEF